MITFQPLQGLVMSYLIHSIGQKTKWTWMLLVMTTHILMLTHTFQLMKRLGITPWVWHDNIALGQCSWTNSTWTSLAIFIPAISTTLLHLVKNGSWHYGCSTPAWAWEQSMPFWHCQRYVQCCPIEQSLIHLVRYEYSDSCSPQQKNFVTELSCSWVGHAGKWWRWNLCIPPDSTSISIGATL